MLPEPSTTMTTSGAWLAGRGATQFGFAGGLGGGVTVGGDAATWGALGTGGSFGSSGALAICGGLGGGGGAGLLSTGTGGGVGGGAGGGGSTQVASWRSRRLCSPLSSSDSWSDCASAVVMSGVRSGGFCFSSTTVGGKGAQARS